MAQVRSYKHGTFCWSDLGTPDLEGAKVFYSELFNWKIEEVPTGEAGTYCLMKIDDTEVAGIYQKPAEDPSPAAWLCYVNVSGLEDAVGTAAEAGAAVLQEPIDAMEAGRMAVLQDPSGAVVGLWEARRHIGAGRVNEPGAPCWFELATRDTAAASDFYRALCGWESKSAPMGPTVYTSFMRGEAPAGGMMAMDDSWGELPPHWMVYFQVADCDGTAARVESLGGHLHVPPRDIPGVGRFAVVADPFGAVFSILQMNAR